MEDFQSCHRAWITQLLIQVGVLPSELQRERSWALLLIDLQSSLLAMTGVRRDFQRYWVRCESCLGCPSIYWSWGATPPNHSTGLFVITDLRLACIFSRLVKTLNSTMLLLISMPAPLLKTHLPFRRQKQWRAGCPLSSLVEPVRPNLSRTVS